MIVCMLLTMTACTSAQFLFWNMATFHTGVSAGICIRPAENMNELPDEYFLED